MKRILHLTLMKKWFDLIASGEKVIEFREIKPFWTKRLFYEGRNKMFDEIHFRNGYSKDSPFMRVKHDGTIDTCIFEEKKCYGILLGRILEIRR